VGFVACGKSQDEDVDREQVGEIYVLYVHPDAWRQGIGSALLDRAMNHLRTDRFTEAVLWVLDGNRQAMRFYEAAGFETDGVRKVKQRRDGSTMPIVRYRRTVDTET
jgi:ribosomal protein S18 acetylase RimI-like enzyme